MHRFCKIGYEVDQGARGNGVDGDDCTDSCKLAVCGDFIQQTSGATIEDCDGGPSGSATCNANCTVSACGDGVLNTLGGENCEVFVDLRFRVLRYKPTH